MVSDNRGHPRTFRIYKLTINNMKTKLPLLKTAILSVSICLIGLSSCKKDHTEIERERYTTGIYVLGEGTVGNNNSAISFYDVEKNLTVVDYYKQVNGIGLGETANDLQQYGSKMYCVVSGIQGEKKSFVDVMELSTGKSIKRISFNTETDGAIPRFIAFYKNKAYVSRYDGKVSRIDTASLTIDGEVMLSEGLEGLAVANGKLYVANSSHRFYQEKGAKNKVSVIDLLNFKKVKDIEVNNNPVSVAAGENGQVFVVTVNDYIIGNAPSLDLINSTTDTKVNSFPYDIGSIAIQQNIGYVVTDPYMNAQVKPLDLNTGALGSPLITDGTSIKTYYGLSINPLNNEVLVSDANGYGTTGFVYAFGTDGKKKYEATVTGLPKHAVYLYKTR